MGITPILPCPMADLCQFFGAMGSFFDTVALMRLFSCYPEA